MGLNFPEPQQIYSNGDYFYMFIFAYKILILRLLFPLYYYYLSLLLLAMLRGLQDLRSLTRNRTSALCSGMEP